MPSDILVLIMHLQSKMFEIIERNQKMQEKIVNQFREIKVMQIWANFFGMVLMQFFHLHIC